MTTINALTAAVLALVPSFARTPHGKIEILQDCTQVVGYARAHRIEPELIAAIILVESTFDRASAGPRGSIGLMGLMNPTLAQRGDYVANIAGGVDLLASYVAYCRGNVEYALTVYNRGGGHTRREWRARKNCKTSVYSDQVMGIYEKMANGTELAEAEERR